MLAELFTSPLRKGNKKFKSAIKTHIKRCINHLISINYFLFCFRELFRELTCLLDRVLLSLDDQQLVLCLHFISVQGSLFLDPSRSLLPSLLYFLHEGISYSPEAVVYLSQVTRDFAGLLSDLPQGLRLEDPLRRILADYLSLSDGVSCDLGRPANRPRLC